MRKFLKTALFLMPIFIIPISINNIKIDMRDARELLFESLTIIALGLVLKNKWLKWFLIYLVINWWIHYFLPAKSTAFLFNVTFGFLIFYLIKNYIKIEAFDGIFKVICWTALFQVGWLVIQHFNIDPIFFPCTDRGVPQTVNGSMLFGAKGTVPDRLLGWLGNANILGAYLALCLPLFRVYYKKLLPIIFIGLLVSRSSCAMVSGCSGLIVFEVFIALKNKQFKRLVGTSVILAGLLTIFFLKIDTFGSDRIVLWKRMLSQNFNWLQFAIGQGLGKFQNLRIMDKGSIWDNPHNEYIRIYFELGILGLIFVFGYLTDLFKRFLKVFNNYAILLMSCITVVLINCIGNFPFGIAATAFLTITYFALMEITLCQNQTNQLSMS